MIFYVFILVGGLRSPVKRQWSAGESNLTRDLSRDLSRTSDLDVRPRLPPRPKSEFFNVGDANKCSKSSTYEVSCKMLEALETNWLLTMLAVLCNL